ncbi:MAG TPA: methylated-DNA--[protein]-cysteine S-methyltransferase [Elusimicrobiota bacterium]|nr:methylated-DNA--[protein]-cysteine S-methyltransferase [Elusimicrobiota bacterium]
MTTYDRIASVIRYVDRHRSEQPDLQRLARVADLSPFYFHRLFSDWAGLTPKDFLQCLTLERAKQSLHRGQNVLSAAWEAGLSGSSRLHDLCISLQAASPGEWKSGGQGWRIVAGFAASPFGDCLLAWGPRGICHVAFVETGRRAAAWATLRAAWPAARLDRRDTGAVRLARRLFRRPTPGSPQPLLRAFVRGTPFQVRVWRALLQTPPGSVVTYGELSKRLNNRKAARAVGSAVGSNSLAYLIPCHRVIRQTGAIGDYRWGSVRKRAMLAWESGITRRAASARSYRRRQESHF